MVNILAKSDPPGASFYSGVPQKNKGQIGNLLSGLLARSAKVHYLPKILHLFAIQTEEIAFSLFFTT